MNKANNKSAAGLRRSAVAERIRLREEWLALKGLENNTKPDTSKPKHKITNMVIKKLQNAERKQILTSVDVNIDNITKKVQNMQVTTDVLRGVVVYVDVGSETRALALRAGLSALGATVVPCWSPLVTHLVWAEGGCRATRAKARALASWLVSPLWVEACACALRRLPERAFRAAERASDLPEPSVLRQMLIKADRENIPLIDIFSDTKCDDEKAKTRLRYSSEHDSSIDKSTDQSNNTTLDTSKASDKSSDQSKESPGVESRVNTAPRRALPKTSDLPTPRPSKSKRKLFTHKEAEVLKASDNDSDADPTPIPRKRTVTKTISNQDRRDLARAERMAKKIINGYTPKRIHILSTQTSLKPRIVLTGMSKQERHLVFKAIKSLNGRIQNSVNKRTTHVLLGSCKKNSHSQTTIDMNQTKNNRDPCLTNQCLESELCGVTIEKCDKRVRTVNALDGAARGCRVLYAQWAVECAREKKWLHHQGYEVSHLKKLSQKARAERSALGKMHTEYAYEIFYGMKVRISQNTEQKEAAKYLLKLCGAVVVENQDERTSASDFDITIGNGEGEIHSKWVFDSIAAARMRTTRRYINKFVSSRELAESMLSNR